MSLPGDGRSPRQRHVYSLSHTHIYTNIHTYTIGSSHLLSTDNTIRLVTYGKVTGVVIRNKSYGSCQPQFQKQLGE